MDIDSILAEMICTEGEFTSSSHANELLTQLLSLLLKNPISYSEKIKIETLIPSFMRDNNISQDGIIAKELANRFSFIFFPVS